MIPNVSVIVPFLNASRTLRASIEALAALDPKPTDILLVDNGSTDDGPSIVRGYTSTASSCPIRLIHESRRGASVARNTGIANCSYDIIAFTDADCLPEANWLSSLIDPFSDPRIGAVAGRVISASPASIVELFCSLYTFQSPSIPGRHRHWTPWEGGFPTANLAIRRTLLEELGGFDEDVGIYGEDYDLCARLYAGGLEIAYVPEARVAHQHRTTLTGLLRQAFGFGRSHPYLLRRHTQRGLWLEAPRFFGHWARFPIRAWIDLAAADKKILAILILSAFYPLASILFPIYLGWLTVVARRRVKQGGYTTSFLGSLQLAGLLLLKSAAMTVGRWWGSVKYGALCL